MVVPRFRYNIDVYVLYIMYCLFVYEYQKWSIKTCRMNISGFEKNLEADSGAFF